MTLKVARDVLVLGLGTVCIFSQIVFQMVMQGEPNYLVIGAGVTLITGYPLIRRGDQEKDEKTQIER